MDHLLYDMTICWIKDIANQKTVNQNSFEMNSR